MRDMSIFDDRVCAAVMRKLAPDMYTALKHADVISMTYPVGNSINLPLTAEARLVHKKHLGNFIVRVKAKGPVDGEFLSSETVFSNRDVTQARDTAALVECVLDGLRERMVRQLADMEAACLLIKP